MGQLPFSCCLVLLLLFLYSSELTTCARHSQRQHIHHKIKQRKQPFDTILYEELHVPSTATTQEIQKAYRKLAIKFHPDKNPGNLEAEEKFKKANEAYAILSNDEARKDYDKYGYESMMDGDSNHQAPDPMEVFREYFGGGRFDHLVGELPNGPWDWEREKDLYHDDVGFQRARALADHLLSRLQLYTSGQWELFDQVAWEEVQAQANEEMGPSVLKLVGRIYVDYGHKNLGLYHSGFFTKQGIIGRIKEMGEKSGTALNFVVAASSTAHVLLRNSLGLHKNRHQCNDKPTSLLVKALWHLSIINIEKTVRQACRMLLKDLNVPPSERKFRAEALIRLGRIYSEIGNIVPIQES